MPQDNSDLTDAATRWTIAQDRAKRANRNLLQYGAALATVLAAFGSVAGILGIADAVKNPGKISTVLFSTSGGDFTIQSLVLALSGTGACFFLVLFVGAAISLLKRGWYEAEAEKQLRKIIMKEPGRFVPKGSGE